MVSFAAAPQKIVDMVNLLRINQASLQQIISEIETLQDQIEPHQIIEVIQRTLKEESAQEAVFNLITNLEISDIEASVNGLLKWLRDNTDEQDPVPESETAQLKEKLTLLLKPLPAIGKMRRLREARDLSTHRVSGFKIYWNARPIFSSDGDAVDGFLPLATLKVTYDDHGPEKSVNFHLTKAVLAQLVAEAHLAQKELAVLEGYLAAVSDKKA